MNPYDRLSAYYDGLMEDVPYDRWAEKIGQLFSEAGVTGGHLLELACGTGQMTKRISGMGYRITGVERSEGMIEQAHFNLTDRMNRITLIQSDMIEYKTKTQFDSGYCVCDGINYLTESGDFEKLLTQLKGQIRPGGLFIFDISTAYKFAHVLDGRTIAENHEDFAFIWENHYNTSDGLLEFELAIFERSGKFFERTEEYHVQKAYDSELILAAATGMGLEIDGPFHEYTEEPARENSERVHYRIRFGGIS